MDFDLSDDQRALKEGIAALVDGVLPLSSTRAAEHLADVVDPAAWSALADAGVFSLLVPEAEGGVGFGLAEGTVVFEELGRVLAPGPVIATTALAPALPAAAAGAPHGVIDAPGRSATPPLLEHPETVKAVVVLPRIEQVAEEATLVPVGDLARTAVERSLDPLTPLAALVTPLAAGMPLEGLDTTALRQRIMVLSGATQVGIAAEVVAIATEYAKGREQFGRPIGGFQAIKHLLADALARTELARAAVQSAAVILDDPTVAEREADTLSLSTVQLRWRAVAGAKLLADEAAIANARTAIQVHGGMGFTWEVPVHLYLKRARVLASSFGTRSELADLLAALA